MSRAGSRLHPLMDEILSGWVADVRAAHTPRVNWLCGCGDGRLGVPEADVPAQCPTCGCPIPGTGEENGL